MYQAEVTALLRGGEMPGTPCRGRVFQPGRLRDKHGSRGDAATAAAIWRRVAQFVIAVSIGDSQPLADVPSENMRSAIAACVANG